MTRAHKFGTLEPVIYFRNVNSPTRPRDWLLIAPYTDCPTPDGYERDGADSLPAVDRLQKVLEEQELAERSADILHDERVFGPLRDRIRDNLYAKLISSNTSPLEKDFIRAYLALRIDKRDRHHAKYLEYNTYLNAREMDTPRDRPVDSERVNLDRVNF
jgi:hypothetical protein